MNEIVIRDRGRGPELARIRITVFDLIPYLRAGYGPEAIADVLPISVAEVLALTKYIEDHRDEVMATNARIEARIARGNPPEIEERMKGSPWHAIIQARAEELRRRRAAGENHKGILTDVNIEGQGRILLGHLRSDVWGDLLRRGADEGEPGLRGSRGGEVPRLSS